MPELKKEQAIAVNHEKGNIMVSASAGSGKTFVMIERIIRLIKEGKANVNEILAVTFTESAAADMKEKLKKALIKQINLGQEELSSQLLEVSCADISTLHAFCSRLIRNYFFVVGVNPDFNIIDQSQSEQLKEQALTLTFKKLYEQKHSFFRVLRLRYAKKRSDAELKEYVLKIFDKCESEARPEQMRYKHRLTYATGLDKRFNEIIAQRKRELIVKKYSLLNYIKDFEAEDSKKGVVFAESIIGDIDALINNNFSNAQDFLSYKKIRRNSFERIDTPRFINAKANAVEIRDNILTVVEKIHELNQAKEAENEQARILSNETDGLMAIVDEFAKNYSVLKKEENVLDFADLEHFVLKLLEDEQVLSDVRSRYKYVFVDEYQDVNGVQEEIITKIANDNLFMVGDVKQSIYGFRGCNPDIFEQKFKRMQENNQKTVNLNYNFRSAERVISTVNKIFSYSMTDSFYGVNYEGESELRAGGIYPEDAEGRACLHLLPHKKKEKIIEESKIYNVLNAISVDTQEQENEIASLVTQIIKDELGKTYYDTKLEKHLPISYKDIVILTRNRDNAYVSGLVNGLIRHGIPVNSEVKQNVCEFNEVLTLINLLKLIDCYKSDVPLVTILKSPYGCFTDEELAEIALFFKENKKEKTRNSTFYDAYKTFIECSSSPLVDKLKNFEKKIEDLRYLSDFIGAKGVLEKFMQECNYQSYVLASDLGEQKLNRVRFFVTQTVTSGRNLTVREMLDKIEKSQKSFEFSHFSEEETVRVMTIHASKGLEFPVVIVCGLERKTSTIEEQEPVYFDRELGFALQLFDDEKRTKKDSYLRALIKERMRDNRLKEELRLLYVALTRASYSLHMTVQGEERLLKSEFSGASRFTDYIPSGVESKVYEDGFEFLRLKERTKKVLVGKPDNNFLEQLKRNFAFNYRFYEDCTLPLKTNVTGLLTDEKILEQPVFKLDFSAQTDKEKGTIAHKFLEHYNFFSDKDFNCQVEDVINDGLMTREELNKIDLEKIRLAISKLDFFSLGSKRLYKEKSFIVGLPANEVLLVNTCTKVLVQGVIDLLVVDGDFAYIVDYKYSSKSREGLINSYQKQLDLYAKAVETALDKKVKEKIIVNIYSGEVIRI